MVNHRGRGEFEELHHEGSNRSWGNTFWGERMWQVPVRATRLLGRSSGLGVLLLALIMVILIKDATSLTCYTTQYTVIP